MDPISGMVEKKVAESAWGFIRAWFTRNRDLKMQVEALQAQLSEARSGELAFEYLMSGLVCFPEDDSIYQNKDGSGAYYCPLCLHGNKELMPLTHGLSRGSYYCRLHDHFFETHELRERRRNYVPQPRTARALLRRLEAESYRQARRKG